MPFGHLLNSAILGHFKYSYHLDNSLLKSDANTLFEFKGLVMKVGAFLLCKFSLETFPEFQPTVSERGGGSAVLGSGGLLTSEGDSSQYSQGDPLL